MEIFDHYLFFRHFLIHNIAQDIGIATTEWQPIHHVPGISFMIPKTNGVIIQKKFIVEKEAAMEDPAKKLQIQLAIDQTCVEILVCKPHIWVLHVDKK